MQGSRGGVLSGVLGHDGRVTQHRHLPSAPDGPPVPDENAPAAGLSRRGALLGGAAGIILGLAGCSPGRTASSGPSVSADPSETSRGATAATPTEATGAPSRAAGALPSGGPPGDVANRPSGGPALELVHAESGRPEISLTFHGAGDPSLGRKVLEVLEKAGVAATVLAVGTWLQTNPDVAKMVTDLGHELGNHTWSHRVMSALSESAQRAEIERCRDRIAALTGGPGAFFRQSSARLPTPELLKLAGAAGYPRVLAYDVDSLDYTDPSSETVRRQVAAAKAGSVVSMHLGHPVTLAALPGILADLRRRELRAVTATRLFAT